MESVETGAYESLVLPLADHEGYDRRRTILIFPSDVDPLEMVRFLDCVQFIVARIALQGLGAVVEPTTVTNG